VNEGLPSNLIRSLYQDFNGNIVVGTSSGIGFYNKAEWTYLSTADGLPTNNILHIKDQATAKGLVIKNSIPMDTIACVDYKMLDAIFRNLITNAVKYSSYGGAIDILLSKSDENFIVSIKDNGIGIEKEYSKKIFEPLKRLHSQSEYSGSGIGLSICKKIIEKHNGKIWVESDIENGSCFKFTIGDRKK